LKAEKRVQHFVPDKREEGAKNVDVVTIKRVIAKCTTGGCG